MDDRRRRLVVLVGIVAAGVLFPDLPCSAGELGQAIKDGQVEYDVRYRYEQVEQDGFVEDAEASTIRLRLGYRTGEYHNFSAFVDFEAVQVIGGEKYNSTANGKTQYPVVADPEDEEINQIYLDYSAPKKTTIRLGRQRITLDNHRFVGNVGWRQNEQTFDAYAVKGQPSDKFSFFAAHLNNANRVFGENNPDPAKAETDMSTELLNVSFKSDHGTVTAYGYLLELKDSPSSSHKNFGLRFSGKTPLAGGPDLLYTGEYADQSDYEDAPSTVDAAYYFGELGLGWKGKAVRVGYEVLEGDGTYAFQTPLATLHKFNGWTDRFLTTPDTGLEDLYVLATAKVSNYAFTGVYHDFSADSGGADYGSELGFIVTKKYDNFSWSVKYADYETDFVPVGTPPPFALDTEIFWITLQVKN